MNIYWNEYHWELFNSEYLNFELYADSYKNTSDRCLESLIQDQSMANSYAIQPAIFCARHAIELLLKFLIVSKRKYDGLELPEELFKNLGNNGHRLSKLVNQVEEVEKLFNSKDVGFEVQYFAEVKSFVSVMEFLDADSTVSRYPVNRTGGTITFDGAGKEFDKAWLSLRPDSLKIEVFGFSSELDKVVKNLKVLAGHIRVLYHQETGGHLWPMNIPGFRLAGLK